MPIEPPIKCPYCKRDIGMTQEQFTFLVIEHDILCPHCGKVVIQAKRTCLTCGRHTCDRQPEDYDPADCNDWRPKYYYKKGELEMFIKLYVPRGWVGPIRDFDFAPLISDEDFKTILSGKMPLDKQYDKWYVRDAINEWRKKNNIHGM